VARCSFVFEPRAIGWHYARRSLRSWMAIPHQYAEYDALIAAKYGPRRLLMVDRELGRRPRLPRSYMALAGTRAGRPLTALTVAGGVALSRRPTMGLGQRLLRLAWQGAYVRTLNRLRPGLLEAESVGAQQPEDPRHAINRG